ncbi:Phosphonate monoester hydrolase [Minicystis rosea]|nr:Phosphonate monoester hydrolase [Minicystis rosea]
MRARELMQSLRAPAMRAESGLLAGVVMLAVASLIHAHTLPGANETRAVAAMRDVTVVGHLLAAGVLSSSAVALWRRFGPARPRLAYLAIAIASIAVTAPALREDLSVLAGKLRIPHGLALALLIVIVAAAVPAAAFAGRMLARPWLRAVGVVLGVAVAMANHFVLPGDYPGMHLVAAIVAATLFGAALTSSSAPPGGRVTFVLRGALGMFGLWAVIARPSNSVALAIHRIPGDVVAPWLARLRERDEGLVELGEAHPSIVAEVQDGWFQSRIGHAQVPASSPRLLPASPIVILMVVDCMRADLLDGDARAADLPAMTALRRAGTQFRTARATAPATSASVSAILSGRYYSQLYWSQWPGATTEWVYPHLDTTPRVADLLGAAGVDTTVISGMPGLVASYGVVHGFAEERVIKAKGRGYADAPPIMEAAIARIRAQRADRPLFLYVHFTDGHAPYDHGSNVGTPFERYLRGIKRIDAELGRLVAQLDASAELRERTAVVLTADHGEGFGEHGSSFHATTLYDELLRVPLIMRLPGGMPHVTTRPVTLLDVAPTLLDLFGQPTPSEMMGQSLVPYLRGQDPTPTRPIAADSSRLMRAMVFPDGFKIIHDRRLGTVELFDLNTDPREKHDLFEQRGEDGAARLRALQAFFHTHTLKRPGGYRVPYGR